MTIALWLARDLFRDDDAARPRHERVASVHSGDPTAAAPADEDAERARSDHLLVERIRVGDVEAFETLSAQYSEALWRYAYRFVRTADLADDVIQDVLFNLWQRREQLDGQRNIRSYLFKDTRFHALNLSRHDQRVRRSESVHDPMLISGTSQEKASPSTEPELYMALEQVLATIPAHRREILLLRWWYGFSYDEIAEVLGLGVSAVKMQIYRATALLRPILERTFRSI